MSANGDPGVAEGAGVGQGPLGLLSAPLSAELVTGMLREVIDPELGVNIVDLGLIYGLEVEDGAVRIAMTLTTPGCPLGGYIEDEIHDCLGQLPQVREVAVRLVWDPPWAPERMSDAARRELGWQG